MLAYAQIPYAREKIPSQTIIDRNADSYLLIIQGWKDKKRVHGCLVHIEIIDDKSWIQRDGIESGIAND